MTNFNFSKINLSKKIQIGLGFSLFILIISSLLSFFSIKELIRLSKQVDHTNVVLKSLENVLSTIKDGETSQRGYLLSGEEDFLNLYNGSYERSMESLETVRILTTDNNRQQKSIERLKLNIDLRFAKLDSVLRVYKSQHKVSKNDILQGRDIMFKCRAIIAELKNEEDRLLVIRTSGTDRFATITPYIIGITSFIAVMVSLLSFYVISKDIEARELSAKELLRLNSELEQNNEQILLNQIELNKNNYLLSKSTELNDLLRPERELKSFGDKLLRFLCDFTKSYSGILFILDDKEVFNLENQFAFDLSSNTRLNFKEGEGLLGQAVLDKKPTLVKDIPESSLTIKSTFLNIEPSSILILPFFHHDKTIAVVELIHKDDFDQKDLEFLNSINLTVSTFLFAIKSEMKTEDFLLQTQNQAEELEAQQEELRQINEEIRFQRDLLQASEEELRTSEEELQEKNAELEEKTNELEEQYERLRYKNQELVNAKDAIQLKMEQFETVSKYKSDFLANMSHELRTPLNSILILAKILKDNRNNTLSEKESQHAGVIEKSGNDLLKLINEILDLARIESGKVNLELSDYKIAEFNLENQFKDLAVEKQIDFQTILDPSLPETIHTDRFRVEQILKNLLSNAFKFTAKEKSIEYEIHKASNEVKFTNPKLKHNETIAFTVKDAGIGIADDKKHIVFEAFQQADLSTTRKFGGSGLGLTISRDLAALLGGEIQFESQLGIGSSFTLYLPYFLDKPQPIENEERIEPVKTVKQIIKPEPVYELKEEKIKGGKTRILIIEDDFYFCNILVDYAEKKGYEVFTANNGKTGFELAQNCIPDAILLDIQLPDTTGWEVLRKFKNDLALKKVPVHLMSAFEKEGSNELGQATFIPKPLTLQMLDQTLGNINRNEDLTPTKTVLIVEDNTIENNAVKELLFTQKLVSESAFSGDEALKMLLDKDFDCVILDINLPDMTGYQVLENIRKTENIKNIPVIIYSGKDLSEKEEAAYKKYANTIIIKTAYSYTRLLEEVKLFLFSIDKSLNKAEYFLKNLNKSEATLKYKKVLIADDDMRNIYSLTNVLEDQGMEVFVAYDGKQAIDELNKNPDIQIVLMDIMMPEMDGIEATKVLRTDERFKNLPIIAVTAKAMPGDKEKCLAAGVSDYASKPIDIPKLISLMRVWLYQN
ncbi:MAG: response regulator [Opitutaceae bacterium]|nr:response regulator [Cytophagales bacterium]